MEENNSLSNKYDAALAKYNTHLSGQLREPEYLHRSDVYYTSPERHRTCWTVNYSPP